MNLRRPSPGALTSGFGVRGGVMHYGADYGWGNGRGISAAAPGKVIHAGPGGKYGARYGNLVVIDHGNGVETRYAHLSRIDVRVGQQVGLLQAIGVMGGSGAKGANTYATHLHFEVRVNGVFVNPEQHFGGTAGGGGTTIEEDDMAFGPNEQWMLDQIYKGLFGQNYKGENVALAPNFSDGKSIREAISLLRQAGGSGGVAPTVEQIESAVAVGVRAALADLPAAGGGTDLTPVLQKLDQIPTAEQNGQAARTAIVKA